MTIINQNVIIKTNLPQKNHWQLESRLKNQTKSTAEKTIGDLKVDLKIKLTLNQHFQIIYNIYNSSCFIHIFTVTELMYSL